ncbi:hypothetical protein [Helicobacter pylori]|nr:hypothetical protein [Helicobacter pylori]
MLNMVLEMLGISVLILALGFSFILAVCLAFWSVSEWISKEP